MPFLERPGAQIYYEVHGEGPAIVFAHGLGGNHMSWWQQVPFFRDGWTCVVFAHRGFAPSRVGDPLPAGAELVAAFADDLSALIDELDLRDVRLVAQSMGGWTCLEYALAHPARVRALVMAATTGTLQPPSHALRAGEDLLARGVHPAAGERMARQQPALHHLYRSIDALSVGLDKNDVRQSLIAARVRPAADVAGFEVPVLGIAGVEDVVIAPDAVLYMTSVLPVARYEEVAEAGHSVYFERAGVFNELVGDFLASL